MSLKQAFIKGIVSGLSLSPDFLGAPNAKETSRQYIEKVTGDAQQTSSWQRVGGYISVAMDKDAAHHHEIEQH